MNLLVLGCGVMGESILAGALESAESMRATVVEPREQRAAELAERYDIRLGDPSSAAADADVVLVAVKPHDVRSALASVADSLPSSALVLSVAAGLPTERLESWLPDGQPVVRAMPNTPALVRAGITAICAGAAASPEHLSLAEQVLAAVGSVVTVPEYQMDAVAAVSGSGPAYVFLLVEALTEAGVRVGLPRELSAALTTATLAGSSALLDSTGEHPALLRERVTSPGGTTAAALHQLEAHGVRAAFLDAVVANRDRSRELAAE
jgi:pyrroline-5-carboxylate reductase